MGDGKEKQFGNACLAKCEGYEEFEPQACGQDKKNLTCMIGKPRKWGNDKEFLKWEKVDSCEPAEGAKCGLGTSWAWASVEDCDECCEAGKCVPCGGGGNLSFESFKDFQDVCSKANEKECLSLGCSVKYSAKKGCKAPSKAKKIKCRAVKDMDLCKKLQCKAKKNTCKGKSKLK